MLNDALDDAILSSRIAPVKDNKHFMLEFYEVALKLDQLNLQFAKSGLVVCAVGFALTMVFVHFEIRVSGDPRRAGFLQLRWKKADKSSEFLNLGQVGPQRRLLLIFTVVGRCARQI
jgi:hypothetical protein